MKLLFVCNQGENRSRTAKELFEKQGYETRAAGIYSDFRPLTHALLQWADKVFVFEEHHVEFIKEHFPDMAWEKPVINLGVEDRYCYRDGGLVEMLKGKIDYYLD